MPFGPRRESARTHPAGSIRNHSFPPPILVEWSLEFSEKVPAWVQRRANRPGTLRDHLYNRFHATIETRLAWRELADLLRNHYQGEGFVFVQEGTASMSLVRKRAVGPGVHRSSANLAFVLRGEQLDIRYSLDKGRGIAGRAAGPLVALFEALETAIHSREDLWVKPGVVSAGGSELRGPDGRVLIPGRITVRTRADPIYGRRILPVILLPLLGLFAIILFRQQLPVLAFGLSGLSIAATLGYAYALERRQPIAVDLEYDRVIIRYRKGFEQIPYEAVARIDKLPEDPYAHFLVTTPALGEKRILLGYEAAYRVDRALKAKRAFDRLAEWMMPSWRMPRDGMPAAMPNRPGSTPEYQGLKYRPYALRDPKRSLILVPVDEDRAILRESATGASRNTTALRRLLVDAVIDDYAEVAAEVGKLLVTSDPTDSRVFLMTFQYLARLKRPNEVEALVQQRSRDRELGAEEHAAMAFVSQEQGRIEDAMFHLGKAVDLDPNCLEALRGWVAIVSAESGKAQALSELDYVASRHPGAWGPYLALAEWMLAMGDRENAEKYGKRALEREEAQQVVSFMSVVYAMSGRWQDLVKLVEDARTRGKAGTPATLNLVQAYMSLGSLRRAKECLEDARSRADREWLPSIAELQETLAAKGVH